MSDIYETTFQRGQREEKTVRNILGILDLGGIFLPGFVGYSHSKGIIMSDHMTLDALVSILPGQLNVQTRYGWFKHSRKNSINEPQMLLNNQTNKLEYPSKQELLDKEISTYRKIIGVAQLASYGIGYGLGKITE